MAGSLGGPVVKRSPGNAGNVSSVPGWGTRILRAVKRLSSQATAGESVRCSRGTREATETRTGKYKEEKNRMSGQNERIVPGNGYIGDCGKKGHRHSQYKYQT